MDLEKRARELAQSMGCRVEVEVYLYDTEVRVEAPRDYRFDCFGVHELVYESEHETSNMDAIWKEVVEDLEFGMSKCPIVRCERCEER